MTLRRATNGILRAVTGYELRRVQPPRAAGGHERSAPPQPQPSQAKAKPNPEFPHDYDDAARGTIRAVKPFTMTSAEKLNALIHSVRYVAQHRIPGDVVECGVWRGGSMMAVARTLLEADDTSRHLHLYDTFEGMSEPSDHDRRHDGRSAAEMLAASPRSSGVWAYASLEDVQQAMGKTDYPTELIHYHRGKVEDTIPKHVPDRISVLRLDTDWFESTRHELAHLWPRLVPGGVLLLDDYGWWEGARRAVDQWLEESGVPLLLLRMDEGRLAVKPPAAWNHDS
ncbi:TylF/MycF/NovP-related O-methyltransferase [Streptomyces sp. HNM0663]|uniref:TylF/MycF/NovP-related O-methyltransferase n=1 Tax=Streptomyces chengmaiensis TaxID=3040919 RepID=A0ABT6HQY6_9ACTN|nr:TylF/MycF/NovP-related O-methyltransferase [Streptomyces chengmaiensis]MDH2391136.1 TylF/MycF/NovP-related O-methyltransferase [Streptomyces chengmaiensis]